MSTARSRALAALAFHAEIRERLRTSVWQEMAALWLASGLDGSLRHGATDQPRDPVRWCTWQEGVAAAALTFHVEPEMMPLLDWATRDLPADTELTHPDLPAESGFLVFGEPWSMSRFRDDAGQDHLALMRAVSWHVGGGGSRGGVWVTWWVAITPDLVRDARLDSPEEQWEDTPGEVAAALVAQCGPVRMHAQHFMPFGTLAGGVRQVLVDRTTGEIHLDADEAAALLEAGKLEATQAVEVNLRRAAIATWLILGQTVTDVTEEPLKPGEAKAWARRRIPPNVVVVRLRHVSAAARPDGRSEVAWQHRWIVRGHWRRQPYGPGGQERRMVWIAPHVKGPEDAPLLAPQKVYDLRR